jgi:hypothetical protein
VGRVAGGQRAMLGGGDADTGRAARGLTRANATPTVGGRMLEVRGGGTMAAVALGSGVGHCAATAVDRAHAEKFSYGVRHREGVKVPQYENFTFIGRLTYIR